jgi:type IV pilus assembly protein PilB
MSRTLDQIFTKLGIAQDALEQAHQRQTNQGGSLRDNLIALHLITADQFTKRVAEQLRVPFANVTDVRTALDVLALLPRDKAEKYLALPLELDTRHRRLSIALADPADMSILGELQFIVGYTLIPQYTPEDELVEAIRTGYARLEEAQLLSATRPGQSQAAAADIQVHRIDLSALAASGTAINQVLAAIFTMARRKRATEFMLDPTLDGLRLWLRIGGTLSELTRFPRRVTAPLLNRMRRILVGENIERTRLLQKGSAIAQFPNNDDVAMSYAIAPALHGEYIHVKLNDPAGSFVVDDLALASEALQLLHAALSPSAGLVLITGPANSGLSTTLYTLINTIQRSERQILSVEDPVEMGVAGVMQGQLGEDAEHTCAQYLQSALQQHSDVVLLPSLSEVIGLPSFLALVTSSLVISSLPAEDAASAASKLALLSSPEFVARHVKCITSQRLVKAVCEACKENVALPESHREKLGFAPQDLCYTGKGCEACEYTGYKGLTLIFEIMPMTDAMKQAIMSAGTVNELRTLNANNRMLSLRDDGMRKVKQGKTTIQEVLKATML